MSQRYLVIIHCVFLLLNLFKTNCYLVQFHGNSKTNHYQCVGCINEKNETLRSIDNKNNILNSSFLHVQEDDNNEFYSLKLNEKNFRWSIPLALGSEKSIIDLVLTISNSSTAFYCHDENKPSLETEVLGYDLSKSTDLKYVDCTNEECTEILGSNKCLILDEYFKLLKGYALRKKSCKSKFCDYVNKMNFLNMSNPGVDKNASVCPFDKKVDNDKIKGFYFNDSFLISKEKKITYNYFGCITENENLNINENTSGIIGLANDYKADKKYSSILNAFISNSGSKKNIFGLCLIDGGGFISFGGYDKAALEPALPAKEIKGSEEYEDLDTSYRNPLLSIGDDSDNLIWTNYSESTNELYKVKVTKINLNVTDDNSEYDVNKDFILDTYDYFISLPREISTKLTEKINKICKDLNDKCKNVENSGTFQMGNEQVGSFPAIEFFFNDNKVVVPPHDYIINDGDNNYKILVKHTENSEKLGIPFFLSKYIIFDNEQKKLGISQSKCQTNNAFSPQDHVDKVQEVVKEPSEVVASLDGDKEPDVVVVPYDEYKGFYEKNKTAILAVSGVAVSGSIIGSIFYLL
ncbi:aspartyl protease, putative [Plasmodium berghei]|uniref:Microgamete surface protein MiGS, putative n=2 Tax=Plasmodium berghei TaxID=5821 RepID=A0A509AV76_PLABA|nr:microgamete surface protein MiGS, putative [Plasmodium berghei ANKA]SCM26855.1 aspartyl protease, putative [Plasmodium berghei]SCO64418.1 aspartyl protease, putative [Plasmodium berghei]VUC58552.1 microgamete surface protein MiGS, putative [Plasmodium berghei ANKA]|eukprot:XP_034424315.1 microgamete surface protein MiGS, putative [Plasmodium berghei ANKA]